MQCRLFRSGQRIYVLGIKTLAFFLETVYHTVSEKASGKRSVFMIYHSTRDEKLTAAPARAVLEGIAPDGGLYVCDPGKLEFDWQGTLQKDTMSMAADILGVLLPDFQDMNGLVRASYAGKFASDDLTPLVPVGERYVLELYHGPTSAFKDVALSVLPRLVSAAAKQERRKQCCPHQPQKYFSAFRCIGNKNAACQKQKRK
jgi:hypothetical protein